MEGQRSLLGVFRGEDHVAEPRFVRVRRLNLELEPLERSLLGGGDGEWCVRRDPVGEVVGRGQQLVALHHRVEQAHARGPFGADHVGRQEELHGMRPGHLPGEAHGRAAAGEQPTRGLHDGEAGVG